MSAAVSRPARLLGFAGLLPQLVFVGALLIRSDVGWQVLAFSYAALILSFLGGIWWGFAVRRQGPQTGLLLLAIAPSLVALALVFLAMLWLSLDWPLVLLGSALPLTLLVDRHLVRTGEAPAGWMGLRVPLSLGLGVLTILAGAV